MTKKTSRREKGITHIVLIVIIIVLLILAGVTIYLAVNNQGIFNKAKTEGGSGSITYTDSSGNTQPLTKATPAGTEIGTTANIDGQTLNWYLFDVSDDGKTAYLVSTPTYWVPDTEKEVSGAWVPKLVSNYDNNTGAIRQAIQKKASGTEWKSYTYEKDKLKYTPSDKTWNYFKSVNPLWSAQRGSVDFKSLNENEQAACYLADADIFAGIKDQVNNAGGNLKGKIQTLVGGPSAEQWCKAYNKQSAASSSKITCAYQSTNTPGYIYKVNDKQSTVSISDYYTGTNTIFGNDIYGAANNNGNKTNNPFYAWWWLASPSSSISNYVCYVNGYSSSLYYDISYYYHIRVSLFASVSL